MAKRRPRVLVVDDSAEMAHSIADGLSDRGYEAVPISSGRDALARLSAERFDALVTDLRMPQVDGLQILAASRGFDPDRLHQEALIIATKADIREELDRLTAHVQDARALIAQGRGVGRKLDFLAQEFNREANTLCSKSADIALTRNGLALKAVIDQFREQSQNVE